MNPPNKLMPWLQAIAAIIILANFFAIIYLSILRPPSDDAKEVVMPMIEVLKAIVLILVGFLFGSAVNSAKKDDQNAALTGQVISQLTPPPTPPAPPAAAPVADPLPVVLATDTPVPVEVMNPAPGTPPIPQRAGDPPGTGPRGFTATGAKT